MDHKFFIPVPFPSGPFGKFSMLPGELEAFDINENTIENNTLSIPKFEDEL